MAGVFLSYAREDTAKARQIAAALEKAGHSVWWDLHIQGGAEYGRVIEEALEKSDAVVVLWSERSVESAWVRDEAAAGRDKGCLIPVLLEPVNPPMGFRQYQNIDLSSWKGRGKPNRLREVLRSIDSMEVGALSGSHCAPALSRSRTSRTIPIALMVGLALAAIAIGGLLVWRPWNANPLSIVSVEPTDQSRSAKILANDLFIKLGTLQAAEANALRLIERGSDAKPDFTFKVGETNATGRAQANLALVDRDGSLLWSREFVQPNDNKADLLQQVAYSAGQVFRCATEASAGDHPKLDASVLSLYLKGCADLSAASDTRVVIPTFRTVTQKAPQFAGGWGKLLIAELEAFKATGASERALQNEMRRHVAEARKVDPELAETYLVQSWLQPPRPISSWMRLADEAFKKKPDNAAILENLATGLGHVGRMREAVEHAQRAREIEPLSPGIRQMLIAFLGDIGAYEAARRELNEAERLWPGASSILQARFWFEYWYGDPKIALAIAESGKADFLPSPAQTSFLRARIDSSPTNIALAIADARKAFERTGLPNQLVQTLGTFGRKNEAIETLLLADPKVAYGIISAFFRRPGLKDVRRDPRFMVIAQRYGLVEYWRASGKWPDFCFEPDLPYDCKAEAAKLS